MRSPVEHWILHELRDVSLTLGDRVLQVVPGVGLMQGQGHPLEPRKNIIIIIFLYPKLPAPGLAVQGLQAGVEHAVVVICRGRGDSLLNSDREGLL